MAKIENCLFCKIVKKEVPAKIIYENKFVLAFLDINPFSKGHTLIISKKCFPNVILGPEKYLAEVAIAQKYIALLLKNKLKAKGFNFLNNHNFLAGQAIFHYHVHVIPKYKHNEGFSFASEKVKTSINLADLQQKINS